jgi:hypothetical protein
MVSFLSYHFARSGSPQVKPFPLTIGVLLPGAILLYSPDR